MNDVKPILFNTDMVRAILAGRKTVTRRLVKPQPKKIVKNVTSYDYRGVLIAIGEIDGRIYEQAVASYRPGDILYVRETWTRFNCEECNGDNITGECLKEPDENRGCYMYKASDIINGDARWRPSIHMPKEAARIFLRVTAVRVERLQDCGNAQAKDEGCTCCIQFARIWDSTIKKSDLALYGWDANPYVWVIEFERISKEEAES